MHKNIRATGLGFVLISISSMLLLLSTPVMADTADQAREVIKNAIQSYGGKVQWIGNGVMVVHESQTRYRAGDPPNVKIVHYMDTSGKGYRLELDNGTGKRVYGWDGRQFWATLDGKPGDAALIVEAKRVISDAFYRFSLPFILDDPDAELEYAGTDNVDGVETQVVKLTYKEAPGSRYWSSQAGADHQEKEQAAGEHKQSGHNESADHHSDRQVYNYYFDEDFQIVKVYFSHHGDESYETLLMGDYKNISGVLKEHSRKLLEADGKPLYDTEFTSIEFRSDIGEDFYKSPGL